MHKENSSFKSDQYPTQRYDYDGIAGMWLLIPSKFHILALALLVPVILWVLPNIHFKGSVHYFLLDYRYYLAAFIAIFFLSSAILSIIKAKQVTLKIRPLSHIKPQVSEKKAVKERSDRTATPVKTAPKINNVKQNPSINSATKPQITIKKSERVSSTTTARDNHSDNRPTASEKIALNKESTPPAAKKPAPKKPTGTPKISIKKQSDQEKINSTEKTAEPVKAKETTVKKTPKKRMPKKKESTKTTTSKKTTKTALTKKAKQLELDL